MKSKITAFVVSMLTLCFLIMPITSFAGDMPKAEGKALWDYMTKESPYQKWEHWPGLPGVYEGKPPHGAFLQVFANDAAMKAARAGGVMPSGAIVVKENIGLDGKTVMAITPMYKLKGYNPEGGDWFWAKYKADGSIAKEGKVGGCIKCHEAVKDTNWIFNKAK